MKKYIIFLIFIQTFNNVFCQENNKKLGIIWFDAHADFNTMETSPSGNLHDIPISVLCGHTLPFLTFGEPLDTNQFAYYGIRDIDTLEFQRLQDYNMLILNRNFEFEKLTMETPKPRTRKRNWKNNVRMTT